MNVMLISPVDALVFDYLSFGIFTLVNNLWTWLALLTAAISFWRFKADKNTYKDDRPVETTTFKSSELENDAVSSSGSTTFVSNKDQVECFQDNKSCPENSGSLTYLSHDNSLTKGKFVTYFNEERVECIDECDDGEETASDEVKWWPERLLMRMRMEDMGWYSCQDLTVVNGNVVRLWDGSVRKEYSSGCVVW